MAQKNYYDILGLKRSATNDEIRRAFRKLAAKYHPDRGGDEQKFKEISEAYTTLADEKKRKEYDQMLQFGAFAGGRGGYSYSAQGADWQDIFSNIKNGDGAFGGFDFSSIFSGAAGPAGAGAAGAYANSRRRAPQKGRDLTITLPISSQEAFRGCAKTVRYKISSTQESQTIEVHIPAGAQNGARLRYKGRGEYSPTPDGARGDLVITTRVLDDPLFHLDKQDVHMDLPVSIFEAALGTEVLIPTPSGKELKLKIPAGTGDAKTFRFKGLGAPSPKHENARGSFYVHVRLQTPMHLSDKERESLEHLRDNDTRDYRKDVEALGSAWK